MKLEGVSNYTLWAFKIKQILLREKLWHIVSPDGAASLGDTGTSNNTTSREPLVIRRSSSTGSLSGQNAASTGQSAPLASQPVAPTENTPTAPTRNAADLQDQKYRAFALLTLSVKDSILPRILMLTEPADVWNVLRNLFESNSTSRRLMLKQKLYIASSLATQSQWKKTCVAFIPF
jgi:hypothetical protein